MFKSYVDFKDWHDYVYFLYSHGTFICLWLLRLVCSCKYNYVVVTQVIAAYHLFYGLFMPNYNRIFHIIQIICTMPNHSNKIFSKWFCINYFLIFCTYLGKLVKSISEHNWNWEDHAPVFDMSLWGINYGRLRLLFICIYIKQIYDMIHCDFWQFVSRSVPCSCVLRDIQCCKTGNLWWAMNFYEK